ncbi:hypothetical protein CHS0354_031985 [Potamilus streckersoni]|uniref:Uncharacterized protein n=1 Tax=Potamilus streckersoni TaxID=2493646 RepID=A0AAE0WEJ9_9BIVA|nr:hypothetical protein CHS0354_031985 [Potamilus streckersoni]
MNSFVVLAVVISLVSAQGSSIILFRKILDNGRKTGHDLVRTMSRNILTLTDDGNNDDDSSSFVGDRGEIMSGNIQEELQNIEKLEDFIRFLLDKKELQDCQGNSCSVCYLGFCLNLVYQASSKQFQVILMYNSITFFSLTLPAKDYQYCKQISIRFITVNFCLKISNVRITDSRACLDMTISAFSFSKTFYNLCM